MNLNSRWEGTKLGFPTDDGAQEFSSRTTVMQIDSSTATNTGNVRDYMIDRILLGQA